jgi:epoxyqueuosine reductase QueG
VRLVSILLDRELPKLVKPIEKSKCGKCDICVIQCPAQAANGKLWDVNTDRDLFYDAFKCSKKCAELSKARLNESVRICGICVSVCPIGEKQRRNAAFSS